MGPHWGFCPALVPSLPSLAFRNLPSRPVREACVLVSSGMPPRRGQYGHNAGYAEACSDWGHGCRQQGIALKNLVPAPRRKSLAALVTAASCRSAARKKSLRPSTEEPEWFVNEARFELVQSADQRFMRYAPSVRGVGVGNRVWGMGNVQFGMVSHMRCTHCKRFGKLSVSGVDEKITGMRSLVRLWCKHCQYRGAGRKRLAWWRHWAAGLRLPWPRGTSLGRGLRLGV